MISISTLPVFNAVCNTLATIALVAGFIFIKRGDVQSHRRCMLTAFGFSVAFLVSYLVYHAKVGDVRFQGTGWIRPAYFSMLISHVILAGLIVPLVLITLTRALRGKFDAHKRIARWTWPVWIYVSVTGVLVYLMVYKIYGPPILPPGVAAEVTASQH